MTPLDARACPTSSRISIAAQQLDAPLALAPAQCRSLLDDLTTITDPRQRRGRQHPLGTVPAVAVAAVLAGVDPDALDQVIGRWLADQLPPAPATRPPPAPRAAWRQAVAVDGKTLRGSGKPPQPAGPAACRDGPCHRCGPGPDRRRGHQ